MTSVLFVCTGNLCRSPLAAGMWRARTRERPAWRTDSAGIRAVVGASAEPLAVTTASAHDADISGHRARQFAQNDFATFDVIVALDASHFDFIVAVQPPDHTAQIQMLTDDAGEVLDVPDPYRCSARIYREVASMIDTGLTTLARQLTAAASGSQRAR